MLLESEGDLWWRSKYSGSAVKVLLVVVHYNRMQLVRIGEQSSGKIFPEVVPETPFPPASLSRL
jgi:hypothetical protein